MQSFTHLANYLLIYFTCGASEGFMKAFKAFIKPFDAPQANQLPGFYMRATLAFNGLNYNKERFQYYRSLLCLKHLSLKKHLPHKIYKILDSSNALQSDSDFPKLQK